MPGEIHERAVRMLVAALNGQYAGPKGEGAVMVRLRPGQDEFRNIAEGVKRWVITDDKEGDLYAVGGIVPDLILYGEGDRPQRIIEVIATNPPSPAKRDKLNKLVERGIDVVEVEVKTTEDLLQMFEPVPHPPSYARRIVPPFPTANAQLARRQQGVHDNTIQVLLEALVGCSPHYRQRLVAVLQELGDIDSLYPLPPVNSK